ncbi:hypothetical protein ILUMI_21080 [Ignelater luminosus]|uniref:Uncharacterized protein n=1 Tax=Ignelater luminosus TaxID=2038154 RepID=A0A8K0CH05_IGNLU|nr:hypothetical protein ILUMI_21080 [Ignelater luminosus]
MIILKFLVVCMGVLCTSASGPHTPNNGKHSGDLLSKVVFQSHRFASNEYRLFPIRLQLNACAAIKADAGGIGSITHCGNFTGCPFVKEKTMHICHWQPDPAHLPPFIPDGQYMIELQGLFGSEEMYIARAYATVYRPIVDYK